MAAIEVSAKTKEHPDPITVKYDFGDGTLKGLVAKFGEDVVYSRAMSALVIDLQALMRRHREAKDFSMEKLNKAVAEWKPTVVTAVRRSAAEKLEDSIQKMTSEQRKELLAKLQASMAGGEASAKPQGKKAA